MGHKPKDVRKLIALVGKSRRHRAVVQDYGDRVEKLCKTHGLPLPLREYEFDKRGYDPPRYDKQSKLKLRKWRFDCAWPDKKVAVECHGGIRGNFQRGRHVRVTGINADAEKSTAAQLQGWMVLVFTADQIPECTFGTAADRLVGMVREALENSRGIEKQKDSPDNGDHPVETK